MPTNARVTSDVVQYLGQPKITAGEQQHLAAVRELPCCICLEGEQQTPTQAHHLLIGGRRVGHYYVLPLCEHHHGLVYLLREADRRRLFYEVNETLQVERDWPKSKVVARP